MNTAVEESLDLTVTSFASLLNQKIVVASDSDDYLAIDHHFFEAAMRPFIRRIRIDATWYVATYPDVATAIKGKIVKDAHDHYERFGYFENRRPYAIAVDEPWYTKAYPDVSQAIARRDFPSAQAHFDRNGFREGRVPYPGFVFELG